jgi:hypothetical protein
VKSDIEEFSQDSLQVLDILGFLVSKDTVSVLEVLVVLLNSSDNVAHKVYGFVVDGGDHGEVLKIDYN